MIFNKRDTTNIDATSISKNYATIIKIIETKISSPRKEKLLQLYSDLEEMIILAPASSKHEFHNCCAGGYLDHVLNVIDCCVKIANVWKTQGCSINWTDEELIFSALNHDLGKVGDDKGNSYYLPNDSDWHVKNLGMIYKKNPELTYMSVPDRGLFLLQKYEIPVTENEYIAIKLHDGLYEDGNKGYLMPFKNEDRPRTNLVYILQQGDFLAAKIEADKYREINNLKY